MSTDTIDWSEFDASPCPRVVQPKRYLRVYLSENGDWIVDTPDAALRYQFQQDWSCSTKTTSSPVVSGKLVIPQGVTIKRYHIGPRIINVAVYFDEKSDMFHYGTSIFRSNPKNSKYTIPYHDDTHGYTALMRLRRRPKTLHPGDYENIIHHILSRFHD
jgi:hypothetical protein